MPKKQTKQDSDKTVLLGILGAVAVLAIVGLVMMFSGAMKSTGMAVGGVPGQFTGFGEGYARFSDVCLSTYEGWTIEQVRNVDKPCADWLAIQDQYTARQEPFVSSGNLVGTYTDARYSAYGPRPISTK